MKNSLAIKPETTRWNWGTTVFLTIAHVAAIVALFFWSWPALICAAVLYWVGGSLGIGMGWHRLLTHRGYRVPKLVEYFLVTCGTMSLEGGPIQWVVTHRIHHAHTDRPGDISICSGTRCGYCERLTYHSAGKPGPRSSSRSRRCYTWFMTRSAWRRCGRWPAERSRAFATHRERHGRQDLATISISGRGKTRSSLRSDGLARKNCRKCQGRTIA